MFCRYCGSHNEQSNEFCHNCGQKIKVSAEKADKPNRKKKKRRVKSAAVLLFIFLFISTAAGTVFYLNVNSSDLLIEYRETIALGDKYLEELDYEMAAIEYERAIEIAPRQEEAYYRAAEAYLSMEEYEKAEEILERGIIEVESVEMAKQKEEIKSSRPTENSKKEEVSSNIPVQDHLTEEDLKEKLIQNTSREIQSFMFEDYDGDGLYEAFAFVGDLTESEYERSFSGELWFVSKNNVERIIEQDSYWSIDNIFLFDDKKILVLEKYFATGSVSKVWGVRDGKPYEEEISQSIYGLSMEDENLYGIVSAYDYTKAEGLGMVGHTWKQYYFYWDDGIKEYGGIQITESDLLKYNGAADILAEINTRGDVTEIYYRENQIININYTVNGDTYENVTLRYDGDKVEIVEFDDYFDDPYKNSSLGGTYSSAACEEIATYPDI